MERTNNPQVSVDVPGPAVGGGYYREAPTTSALFRDTSHLEEIVEEAGLRFPGGELRAVSGGCSYGAEAYSLASLLVRAECFSDILVTGVDTNQEMLDIAEQGIYRAGEKQIETTDFLGVMDALREADFEVGWIDLNDEGGAFQRLRRLWTPRYGLEIGCQAIRQNARVEFINEDLAEPETLRPNSRDIVLVNNVLYHLTTDEAARVLANAGAAVRENGLLSICGYPVPFGKDSNRRIMPTEREAPLQNYREWMMPATEAIAEMFDMRPIIRGDNLPVVFAKDSSKVPTSSDLARFQETLGQPLTFFSP